MAPAGNSAARHSREAAGDEEDTGLLAAGASADDTANESADGQRGRPERSPRTLHRVRFDLRPTVVVVGGENGHGNGSANESYMHARESFDVDEADPLHAGRPQRLPLLADIEASSVALATRRWSDADRADDDAHAGVLALHMRPKSGMRMAFMNMANSIIGAGIIGQPYAFRQAGLLTGTALLVLLTVVVDWTICLIVVNTKLSGANSFQGTVEYCFGRPGLVAISIAQWAFAFGGMVAFGVIVGDSIPHVVEGVWPGIGEVPVLGLMADRRAIIVVCTLGVSYPLALYRDIAKLAKASTLALTSMAIILGTVVVQGALVPPEERGQLKGWRLLIVNDGIFQAIGVISFAFVCHHNSLLIYGSLKTPTLDRFSRVTHLSTGVSLLACLAMALAGFLTFGDRTLGNVLNNFKPDNTMVNLARLCFGLNMLTTLPLEAFVCREVMFTYWFPGEPFNMNLHLIFTTALVVSAMFLSLITCDLGAVFELVGATSACVIAYILPPLCYIRLTTRSWRTCIAWAVVGFGTVVMGSSLLQAGAKIILGGGEVRQCM